MAQSKLIDIDLLSRYDGKIKELMATEDAKSLKSLSYNSSTRVVSFFKTEDASGTAAYTVTLPDTSNFIEKISGGANGNFVVQDANGSLVDGGSSITASKIAIVDAGGLITATDVEGALQELASASSGGVASKTVYITETAGSGSDPYSKRYGVYQGSTGSSSSPVAGEKLADIDIPKDMVVEDGSVVDVVFVAADNSLHEGSASGTDVTAEIKGTGTATSADAGKYIKLTIANATSSHLWIKATDLVDIYTAQQNATQVQLVIDANNEISATIVAGSIDTTELANSAVTTAKIADSNVTTAKIADENVTLGKLASAVQTSLGKADSAVQSVVEGATNGTVAVDGTDVAVHGLGSAAYTASTAYDAAGAAAAAVAALDSNTSTATNTEESGLVVLSEVGIVDGMISKKKSKTLGSAATHADSDFLATADYGMASTSDIDDLFD